MGGCGRVHCPPYFREISYFLSYNVQVHVSATLLQLYKKVYSFGRTGRNQCLSEPISPRYSILTGPGSANVSQEDSGIMDGRTWAFLSIPTLNLNSREQV